MNPRHDRICELLCKFGRAEVLKHFRQDSCIASTKVVVKTLAHFKINARPLSVDVEVCNPTYCRLYDQINRLPNEEELKLWVEQGARLVCIDSSGDKVGHVVAIVENELMIDLSIDQFNRPEKEIVISDGEGMGGVLPRNFVRNGGRVSYNCNGCSIVYWAQPENKFFLKSPNWQVGSQTQPIVDAMIRRIVRAL